MSNLNSFKNLFLSLKSKQLFEVYKAAKFDDNDIEKHLMSEILNPMSTKEVPEFIKNEQEKIKSDFLTTNSKWVDFHAPTSFGKSKIIKDLINLDSTSKYLIVVPTLALCNEYFFDLNKKYKGEVSMSFYGNSRIYILTPEKTCTLFEFNKAIEFKYSFFDEFYETFAGFSRYKKFISAFNWSLEKSKKILTVSPAVIDLDLSDISSKPLNIYSEVTATTREITYYQNKGSSCNVYKSINYYNKSSNPGFLIHELENKSASIFNVTASLFKNSKTINKVLILDSKRTMIPHSFIMASELKIDTGKFEIIPEIISYLQTNAPDTMLISLLKKGIAYHNGSMDKFVRLLIEVAFEKGEIKILFANSTLTKGVNLNPQFLIVNSFKKGKELTDAQHDIDIKNAVGRTGRMMPGSYIGNLILIKTYSPDSEGKLLKAINLNEKIKLCKPESKFVKVSKNFSDAYDKLSVEGDSKIILNKLDAEILKKFVEDRSSENIEKVVNLVVKKFQIEYPGKSLKYWKFVAKLQLKNMGYKQIYTHKVSKAVTDGYLALSNTGMYSSTSKKEFRTKKGVIKHNIKYDPSSYHNDYLMMSAIAEYEDEIGFKFNQLLSTLLDKAIFQGFLSHDTYSTFLERQEEDSVIATENGWPDSFAKYYIHSHKSEKTKKMLNNLMVKMNK